MSTITTRAGKGSPLTNNEVDANFTNLNTDKAELSGAAFTGAITTTSTVDGRDVATDGSKLDGIEAGATADQTAAEIKTAYESNADTNAFTDADESKLDGIEASADVTDTTNVTAAGALMDSELTAIASVKALNQGVATTDSPTFAGLTSTGEITANGGIALGDNDKATFGAGDDLQIYHDGEHSYVSDTGIGYLKLKGSNYVQIMDASNAVMANFESGGAVYLSHNGADRFSTTATGIDVTGSVTADGQLTSARGSDTGTYGFRHEGAGKYLRMGVPNASFAYFETDANGGFSFEGNVTVPNQILHAGDTDTYMQFHAVNEWRVVAGGYERFAIGPHVVVNEDSHDQDFRVESNGNANMLFVDGGGDCVSIGSSSDKGATLNIEGNVRRGSYTTLSNFNSNNDVLAFGYNIATNASTVTPQYSGDGGAGGSFIHMESGGGGTLDFRSALHGTDASAFTYTEAGKYLTIRPTAKAQGELVVNQDSNAHIDFRVESDSNANGLTLDASTSTVGVNRPAAAAVGLSVNATATNATTYALEACNATSNTRFIVRSDGYSGFYKSNNAGGFIHNTDGAITITPDAGGHFVFNQDGSDADFRVESDNKSHMLYVDSSLDFVGFETNTRINSSATTGFLTPAGGICIETQVSGGNGYYGLWLHNNAGTQTGYIYNNGSSTSYNTASDERLKENILDSEDAGALIDNIQVRSFSWKETGEHQRYGMVAQELQTVAPEAVHEPEDADTMMGVDYSTLVPMLIKEIQSLRNRVAQLEE